MKYIVLNIVLLFAFITNAQDIKRTAIWYFGENAGIDFNTTPPTALTDGQVNTIEGCASICDTNGNLLFYTDGRTVWNKYHDTMSNGFGLLGNESSTQAALIVPKPNTDSIYYIFTTSPDFYVNEVNIFANGSKGEVILKNKLLIASVGEKQTATKHANGIDYWVITHGSNNDEYYAFRVTEYGIVNCPVISKIGTDFSVTGDWYINQGSMKAASNGKKIATCLWETRYTELFDFNATTGLLTNLIKLYVEGYSVDIEFSNSCKFLYNIVRDRFLVQYDISYNNAIDIVNSKKVIYNILPYEFNRLQKEINGKIIVGIVGRNNLGVINEPELSDTNCHFEFNGLYILPKKSLFGLPDFVGSFFYQPSIDFSYTHDCSANTLAFKGYDTLNATTYKWYFAKGNITDSANTQNPTYTFADTGNHTITYIASNGSITDTVIKTLFIHPKYTLYLGSDTVVCAIPFTLNAGAGQFCYTWQDSSSSNTFEVNQSGTYHVKVVSQNHCTQFDTINVTVALSPAKPIITRNSDTLQSTVAISYQWYKDNNTINGATQREYKITQNGVYTVETTDSNGCKSTSNNFSYIWVGIEKINAGHTFLVYPNSTNNVLFIDKPVGINTYLLKITDIQGKELITKQLIRETEEIDLTAIAEGIYLLQIGINGKLQETHRLIIKK